MLSTATGALLASWAAIVAGHAGHDQKSLSGPHQSLWYNTLPGDGGTQVSVPFSRVSISHGMF